MPLFAGVLLVATVALWLIDRSAPTEGPARGRGPRITLAVLSVLIASANLVWVYRVGDSGARSVWTARVAASAQRPAGAGGSGGVGAAAALPAAPIGSATPDDHQNVAATPAPSTPGESTAPGASQAAGRSAGRAAATQADTFTMAQVAAHADRTSCWTAIFGSVYDLTEWIGQHPGGSQRILPLCGTDATAAFSAQHGGQARPASELATFFLGPLTG